MNKVKYSIVVPSKDRHQLILDTIKAINIAVKESKLPKNLFELIIVDDSNDIYKVNSHFIKTQTAESEYKNLGSARNTGAKLAKGKYVVYFDDDLIISKDYFSQLER